MDVNELFEQTKKSVKEILHSDFANKIKKYIFDGIEYKFTDETVADMLPNLQAINAGMLDEVVAYDVDGNEILMSAEDYIKRNSEGFKNKIAHEIDLNKLLVILEEIQTFTALANFGSFDMAKTFYIENAVEETEDAEADVE